MALEREALLRLVVSWGWLVASACGCLLCGLPVEVLDAHSPLDRPHRGSLLIWEYRNAPGHRGNPSATRRDREGSQDERVRALSNRVQLLHLFLPVLLLGRRLWHSETLVHYYTINRALLSKRLHVGCMCSVLEAPKDSKRTSSPGLGPF